MNPISTPLTRVGDINLVGERLAVRNAALSDTNSTVIPRCPIEKHAMVVERAGIVEVIGRMDDEGVIRANGYWRRAGNLDKNGGESARGREKTDGQVP